MQLNLEPIGKFFTRTLHSSLASYTYSQANQKCTIARPKLPTNHFSFQSRTSKSRLAALYSSSLPNQFYSARSSSVHLLVIPSPPAMSIWLRAGVVIISASNFSNKCANNSSAAASKEFLCRWEIGVITPAETGEFWSVMIYFPRRNVLACVACEDRSICLAARSVFWFLLVRSGFKVARGRP